MNFVSFLLKIESLGEWIENIHPTGTRGTGIAIYKSV